MLSKCDVEQSAPSARDQRAARWQSATPAGPARSLNPREIARLGYTPPAHWNPDAPVTFLGDFPKDHPGPGVLSKGMRWPQRRRKR